MTVKDLKDLLRMAPDSAVLTIGRHSTLVEFTDLDVESPQFSGDHIHVNLNMDPNHLICSEKFLNLLWNRNSTLLLKEHEMAEEMHKINEEWQENLKIQREMLIDKACKWVDDNVGTLTAIALRKAMEEWI